MSSKFQLTIFLGSALLFPACAHRVAKVAEPEFVPGPNLFKVKHQLSEFRTIRVGSYPKSVSINADQKRAYICNLEGGSVDVVDLDSYTLLKRIEFKRTAIPASDGTEHADLFEEKPVEIGFTGQGRY